MKVESKGIRKNFAKLITKRGDIEPLLRINWLREIIWIIQGFESATNTTDQSEKDRTKTNFQKLLKTNRMITDTENKIQLKPGHPPKTRKPDPYHIICRALSERK